MLTLALDRVVGVVADMRVNKVKYEVTRKLVAVLTLVKVKVVGEVMDKTC